MRTHPAFPTTTRATILCAALLLLGAPARALAQAAPDGGATLEQNQACIDCHTDKDATMDFDDGTSVSIFVDPAVLAASVHKDKLMCTDCHRQNTEFPHPDANKKTHKDYTLSLYEMCRRCHFANYTRTLEGVHYKLIAKGDPKAPTCVDCHGSHAMKAAGKPRADISKTCATCHEKVFEAYSKSVHGKALLDEHNEDVPVCTDCHRSHDIADPHKKEFLRQVPLTCGRCHADEERMKKYKLSTAVLRTYLSDFHGVTTKLYAQTKENGRVVAVCVDCHGIHDIATTHDRDPKEIKENLQKRCAKCHKEANLNFPDAWLPHYEPSLDKAPLVFGVKVFYWIFIPLVIGGLLLQILLHIWRIAVNR